MQPQLRETLDEFNSATHRLRDLVSASSEAEWSRRPTPEEWSAAECVAHLNLTAEAFLPLLRHGLAQAGARGEPAPARYRRDLFGWLLWKVSGPGGRMRVKTGPAFVPIGDRGRDGLVAEFERLQAEQVECLREADGLPLQKVRIVSPFDARVRYNLYSALTILARHQHRHLQQAENAVLRATG